MVLLKPSRVLISAAALLVEATFDCLDYEGKARKVGERWLVKGRGAYLPSLTEQVFGTVKAHTLTETKAIHVLATTNCKVPFFFFALGSNVLGCVRRGP
jgi:hypothetical protein